MARPKRNMDYTTFEELYNRGYHDAAIAEELGCDRSYVAKMRKWVNLPANRKVGHRGPSVKQDEPYWLAVRRSLQYVGKYIFEAARKYYEETKDWDRYFICGVLEPKPMTHAIPSPHYGDPEKWNFKHGQNIIDYEEQAERYSLAGCPGPAILELAKVYKSADEDTCQRLAMEAVQTSGYVSAYATVADTKALTPPEILIRFWKQQLEAIQEWIPVKAWTPIRKLKAMYTKAKEAKAVAKEYYSRGSGKRGRGGGIQSTHNHAAYQAALGY